MKSKDITIILAPLQGFTDVTYRNVYADHFKGIDEAVAPFISTMGQQRLKPSRIKDVIPDKNQKLTVTPQILGNVPEDFIFLANYLFEMGHKQINWNLGCPHSKIAKKKRGSGLLMYPEAIAKFLDAVIPKMTGTLSVKIRLGRKSKDEISRLLPVFDAYPLDEIILHPRTGVQMYSGKSDLDAFEAAIKNSRHSFVYNGDLTDIESFDTVKSRFPSVNRFMIGRGILANPFLPEQIKAITAPDGKIIRLKAFHDDLLENYKKIFSGPRHLTDRMKGFLTYLGPSFKESRKPLKKVLKSGSLEAYLKNAEAFFEKADKFIH